MIPPLIAAVFPPAVTWLFSSLSRLAGTEYGIGGSALARSCCALGILWACAVRGSAAGVLVSAAVIVASAVLAAPWRYRRRLARISGGAG